MVIDTATPEKSRKGRKPKKVAPKADTPVKEQTTPVVAKKVQRAPVTVIEKRQTRQATSKDKKVDKSSSSRKASA